MSAQLLDLLFDESEELTADEQLALAMRLIERARWSAPTPLRRKWGEVCGLFAHPLAGEDAQIWVTRTRSQGDEQRAKQWERTL